MTILRTIPLFFFLLSFAIVLLNDGGVYPLSLAVAVIFMALSLATAGLTQGLHRETAGLFGLVLALWLVLILWTVIQALSLPSGLLANTAWASLREEGIEAPGHISVAPGDTFASLLPLSLPFMTLLSALLLFRSDRQVELTLRVSGMCGAAFAIFAIAQFVLFPHMLMFSPKESYIGSLTAPFVNRNTAATFYGLVTVVLFVCSALAVSKSDRRWERRSNQGAILRQWAFPLMALAAVIALALTRSRAGVAASVAGCGLLLVALAVHFAGQKTPRTMRSTDWSQGRSRRATAALGTLILVVVASFLIFGRAILRIAAQEGEGGRLCNLPGIWQAIEENVFFGIGSGSFRLYFPAYRNADCGLAGTWFRAHNFYLDMILALGLLLAVAIIAAVLIILARIYMTGLRRRKSKKPVVFGGISAVLLVALHAIPDFSLQIPGFAMSFALFLGLTATISLNATDMRSVRNK